MEDIIERLNSGKDQNMLINAVHQDENDDVNAFLTLPLTSECESHELSRLLTAMSTNTSVRRVVFRESFFPLRRIRQHLSKSEFIAFLQGVGRLARDTLEIYPCMKGMIRARLLATIILPSPTLSPTPLPPPSLKCLTISSLTLIDCYDVKFLAHALSVCDLLEHVVLKDCFVSTFREEPLLNSLISTLATRPRLKLLDISCQNERAGHGITTISRRRNKIPFPFFYASVLQTLLESRASKTNLSSAVHDQSPCLLESLRLCNLGLQDDHFYVVAKHLHQQQDGSLGERGGPSCGVSSLKHISLDENHPTQSGFDAVMMALNSKYQSVETVSVDMNEGDFDTNTNTGRPGITLKDDILNQLIDYNYNLKRCSLNHCFEDSQDNQQCYLQQKLEFFLKINRCDRKNIFANDADMCNTKSWSTLTERIHDDPCAMYYFLKSMPGIIMSSA